METFLIKAAQLILSLSLLIVVHELGHFFFSRILKVNVDKLYLFYNPWFSLFKYTSKKSGTEYGIGWLPIGGYCKITGMIDESLDKEQLAQPPQPFEYRSRPPWQRLLMTVGGVLFNFLLALFIYSSILFAWGDSYVPLKNMTAGMAFSETFHNVGFQDGDILLAADGKELKRFGADALRAVAQAHSVSVLRNGKEIAIPIPEDMMQRCIRDKQGFAFVRIPMIVEALPVGMNSPASLAGILPGDTIVAVNGLPTPTIDAVTSALRSHKSEEITLSIRRSDSAEQTFALTTDSAGLIGIFVVIDPARVYPTVTTSYSFFQSIPAGISLGFNTLKGYVSDMQYVFTKEGASSLGGFGAIGSMFPSAWHWPAFWERTAFLSIILAFMNILPLPALDGGHAAFAIYEMITRRKPHDKFVEYAQVVGMILLFALLFYANANDIVRFFFHN
ncbi:MAG: RIP metalloprotease RseP [Tannerellaceae bacterium]|jgi:regulator of sigma E protease|nr:RIP metalloprotease RseP [Tannerellaceae bacterium]